MTAAARKPTRKQLEKMASARMELDRRKRARKNKDKTTYGIYEPTGEYGGRLLRVLQDDGSGTYVEVHGVAEPQVKVPLKLEKFLTTEKRFKVAYGGRGGAKSFTFGDIFSTRAKDYGEKVMCLRELQNSIDDSVKAMIADAIDRLELDNFDVIDKEIRFDGSPAFRFKGLHRNPTAVKSAHGFVRSWVEEAQTLSDESLTMLTPSIREAGGELWFSLNPGSSADPMSQRFIKPFEAQLLRDGIYEDDEHLIVRINYTDNPWHRELEGERQFAEEHMSAAKYNHVWLGDYNDEVENSIIPAEWFDAAIDAHVKLGWKPQGAKVMAHDPSDSGFDAKGLAYRHGSVFKYVGEKISSDVNEGCDWATEFAIDEDVDYFTWDCDGLGVSLRRQVSQAFAGKKIEFEEFKGSHAVDRPLQPYDPKAMGGKPKPNKDTFRNKRSQYYWTMRDRFYNTYRAVTTGEYVDPAELISLSSSISNMDALRAEVCRIPLQENNTGYIQIMSKKDMKRLHQIDSPNMADSMMMSLAVGSPTKAAKRHKTSIPMIKARRMS